MALWHAVLEWWVGPDFDARRILEGWGWGRVAGQRRLG